MGSLNRNGLAAALMALAVAGCGSTATSGADSTGTSTTSVGIGSPTSSEASSNPAAPPTQVPTVALSHGPAVDCATGDAGTGCFLVVVSLAHFPPGTSYNATLENREGNWTGSSGDVALTKTDATGASVTSTGYWYGFPNGWVGATVDGVHSELNPWGAS